MVLQKQNPNKILPKIKNIYKSILKSSPSSKKMTYTPLTPSLPSSPRSSSSSLSTATTDLKDDIQKVFKYIDENNDGKISPAELKKCVTTVGAQQLSSKEAEAIVECSDSDGDGFLSLEDFEKLMEGKELSEEEKKEELREAFEMYNDTKGVITAKSLRKMLCRLGEKISVEECKGMIRVYDLDRDGVLSFQEFVAMMT